MYSIHIHIHMHVYNLPQILQYTAFTFYMQGFYSPFLSNAWIKILVMFHLSCLGAVCFCANTICFSWSSWAIWVLFVHLLKALQLVVPVQWNLWIMKNSRRKMKTRVTKKAIFLIQYLLSVPMASTPILLNWDLWAAWFAKACFIKVASVCPAPTNFAGEWWYMWEISCALLIEGFYGFLLSDQLTEYAYPALRIARCVVLT